MTIAETFLSAFLQVLFEKMLSPGVNFFMEQFKGGAQQQKYIKEWQKQLQMIEAVLSDAEHQMQLQSRNSSNNNGVTAWMRDLRDLAYDMEDVLDSLATQALTYQLMIKEDDRGRKSKDKDPMFMVQSIVGGGSKIVDHLSLMLSSNQDFSARIEDINQQLKEIVSQTKVLGLSVHVTPQQVVLLKSEMAMQSWRESTSLLCEASIYGREGERKEIIHHLCCNDESSSSGNYTVIPIVGKGGIGKTTLAQLIYNDDELEVYDVKAWVYVSQVFDAKRITTSLFNSITGGSNSFCDLNQAQQRLKQVLKNKRFLIVLDDMWSERYGDWNDLRTPFRAAAMGSRVVTTTRSQKVARITNPRLKKMISLEGLSDDDCWNLILQHAFDDVNVTLSLNYTLVKDDLIRKCKGVPMVAKALGGLLRTKVEESCEWEEETLKNDTLSIHETGVLEVLELSYHVLPSHLKRCLAYCSIFPYDHLFTEEDVILLWMAEGFLPENVMNKQMEDIGHEYFHDLVSRSFFEQSSKGSEFYKMHSLQSDLAKKVAGDLCLAIRECSTRKHKASSRARHLSFSKLDECEDCKGLFHLEEVSHFRTFAHFGKHIHSGSSGLVLELVGKFLYIKVLSLPRMGITKFSESIGNLKLLRYLNLSYNSIEELPSSIINLVNLQTLLLKGCDKLQKLLPNMRFLNNLRHLDINGTPIKEMPLGIGDLVNLQTLHTFIIGTNATVITELMSLNQLRGKLAITGLENMVSFDHASKARLHDKSGLDELELVWEWGTFANGVDDNIKLDVLDQLKPHKSTKVLTLRNYKGVTFPNWLGDPSFTKMVVIKLVGCERCESLPSLGKLPFLKELFVQEMRGLTKVDCDFEGVDCSNPFPALRILEFKSMASWENWLQSSCSDKGFSCLQELSIKDCPSLQQSLPSYLPMLQILKIQNCKQLNASLPCVPQLQKLIIEDCASLVKVDQLPLTLRQLVISSCCKLQFVEFMEVHSYDGENIFLEVLEVVNCQSLLTLLSKHRPDFLEAHLPSPSVGLMDTKGIVFSSELSFFEEGLCPSKLANLTKLTISDCSYLTSFPEDLVLPSLRNLLISVCRNLEALPNQMQNFTSLQDLIVTNCPKLRYFPKGGLPINLTSLYLDGLNMVQPMPQWELHNLLYLEKLSISDVGCSSNSIETLPDDNLKLPSSLSGLAISGFLNLKSLSCSGLSNLTSLYMRRCPKLECFVDNCVPPGLKELWVVQCHVLKHQMEQHPLRHSLSCITTLQLC